MRTSPIRSSRKSARTRGGRDGPQGGAAEGTPAPCSSQKSTGRPVPPRLYPIQLPAESSGLKSSSTALGSLVSKSNTFAHSGKMVMRAICS